MSVSTAAAGAFAVVNAMALFKLSNGEYSASSVATDPADAARLGLMRLKDNNYAPPLFVGSDTFPSSAALKSSTGIQTALTNLVLGG